MAEEFGIALAAGHRGVSGRSPGDIVVVGSVPKGGAVLRSEQSRGPNLRDRRLGGRRPCWQSFLRDARSLPETTPSPLPPFPGSAWAVSRERRLASP